VYGTPQRAANRVQVRVFGAAMRRLATGTVATSGTAARSVRLNVVRKVAAAMRPL